MAKFKYYNSKACYMCPKCFLKIAEKSNNYQLYLPDFLNVAGYWQSSDTCARKLSQILANNIDNGKYLQTTLIIVGGERGGGGLVSEFMWGIVDITMSSISTSSNRIRFFRWWNFCYSISVSPNVIIYILIFLYVTENVFIFYNDPLFCLNKHCNKFMASLLLIPLKMQQ